MLNYTGFCRCASWSIDDRDVVRPGQTEACARPNSGDSSGMAFERVFVEKNLELSWSPIGRLMISSQRFCFLLAVAIAFPPAFF